LLVDTAGYHEMQNPISIDLSHLFLLLCTSQCFCRCGHCPQKHSEIMQEKKQTFALHKRKKEPCFWTLLCFSLGALLTCWRKATNLHMKSPNIQPGRG